MNDTQENPQALALPTDPKIIQAVRVAIPALIVASGGQELVTDLKSRLADAITGIHEFTQPPTNIEEQEEILAAQRVAQKLRTEIDKAAAAFKAQLNGPKGTIHEMAEALVEKLKKAELHAQSLVNHFQQKLTDERNRQAAEVARQAEELRKKEQEAQQQREQAERDRELALAAEQRAAQAKTEAARIKALGDAAALREQATAKDEAAFRTEMQIESTPVRMVQPDIKPQAKTIRDFTIAGRSPSEKKASLIKLLCEHPSFWTAHIAEEKPRSFTLTLKVQDLMDALAGKEPFAKLESAPGIVISERLSQLR